MPVDPPGSATSQGEMSTVPSPDRDGDSEYGPSKLQLALVVLLVFTLAMGLVILLRQMDPNGPWRLMPAYALFVAVESAITRRWLIWPERKRQHQLYTLAELVVLLALAPLFLWLGNGEFPFSSSLIELLESPSRAITLPMALYMLMAFFVWQRVHGWAEIFIQLAISPDEVRFHGSTATERSSDWSIASPLKHRAARLKAFVQGWIGGGVFLILVTALVSYDLVAVSASLSEGQGLRTITRLGLAQESLLALLVYFLGGLWLISQGRAVVLQGRWLADGSRRDPKILSRWSRWAPLFIISLAVLALFLPIGTTYPFLRVLQALASFIYAIVTRIMAILSLLLYFIVSLLPAGEAQPEPPPLDLNPLADQPLLPADNPITIPPLFAGSVFWLALIGLTIVAVLYFMSGRGPNNTLAQLTALWRRFRRWLLALGQDTSDRITYLTQSVRWRMRRPSLGRADGSPLRFLRVGALPPREQIRFLYLSLVRYAGKQGFERPPEATPIEFTQSLKAHWPDAVADLELLTAAFLVARYAADEIDQGQLKSARAAWLTIRRRGRQSVDPPPDG